MPAGLSGKAIETNKCAGGTHALPLLHHGMNSNCSDFSEHPLSAVTFYNSLVSRMRKRKRQNASFRTKASALAKNAMNESSTQRLLHPGSTSVGDRNTTLLHARTSCCTSVHAIRAGQSAVVQPCCWAVRAAAPAIGERMTVQDPPVRSCTRSSTRSMDASLSCKRTAYALGASEDEDLIDANSEPKLTRHTGVGNGLLNRSPKGVSKHMHCESTHTDTA